MLGASRFDPQCEKVQAETKAQLVLLIVYGGIDSNGEFGDGVACRCRPKLAGQVPALLRQYADKLEAEGGILMIDGPSGVTGGKGPRRVHGRRSTD